MSAGLKGDTSTLKKFAAALRQLPRVVAQKVAAEVAPAITQAAQATFAAGETPDGILWAPSAEGERVTLRASGALERGVHYVAIGTKIRVVLGVAWAKYQIGKRPVFPRQGSALPPTYVAALEQATGDVLRAELAVRS